MPVKRRNDKRRPVLPEPLQRIIDGELVEFSQETRELLIGVRYFGDFKDEMTDDAQRQVIALLDAWRPGS